MTHTSARAPGPIDSGTRGRGCTGAGPLRWSPMKDFDSLYAELIERAGTRPEGSGTVRLLDRGVNAIGKKVVEEAAEVWMAAKHETADELAMEISQVIYHLQVMMVARGLRPQDVYRHL